jgi:hypothetical protein
MRNTRLLMLRIILIFVFAFSASARDIRIVCPYIGPVTDVYKNDERNLDLKDNSLLKGVFFQWVNPDSYQWNAFIYQSSDINYSTLWGSHFIFDYYFLSGKLGKFVIGAGIEYLKIDMDADSSIIPLKDFELYNNLFIPYVRFGYRFHSNYGKFINIYILPWMGAEYQGVRGDLTMVMDPPGPAPEVTTEENIDNDNLFAMAGLNFKANLFHMFDLEAKYNCTFDTKVYYSTATAMVNLFFTRKLGISYRIKYMELEKGSDLYNIFGIALVF